MKRLEQILSIVLSLMIVFFILASAILLLLNPIFLNLEYHTPNFPPDLYGFTLHERLQWSKLSVEYLINSADISFLGNLKFPDNLPLFTERELSHMSDVKRLVQAVIVAWCFITVLLALSLVRAWRIHGLPEWGKALSFGGWLTGGLILAIFIAILVNFNNLFTGFHEIFFQGDSWLFAYSDTLIRLFPMMFWQDAFIAVGVISLIFSFLAVFIGHKLVISSKS
jgi:integral membrane protein (TIGR01906 family)